MPWPEPRPLAAFTLLIAESSELTRSVMSVLALALIPASVLGTSLLPLLPVLPVAPELPPGVVAPAAPAVPNVAADARARTPRRMRCVRPFGM